jgi:hypothetical protein
MNMSEEKEERTHWKRNMTIGIVSISAIVIFSFAIYGQQPSAAVPWGRMQDNV